MADLDIDLNKAREIVGKHFSAHERDGDIRSFFYHAMPSLVQAFYEYFDTPVITPDMRKQAKKDKHYREEYEDEYCSGGIGMIGRRWITFEQFRERKQRQEEREAAEEERQRELDRQMKEDYYNDYYKTIGYIEDE